MALRINLYHEVLRTRQQKRYDPLKLSMFGLILIAIGLVSWYFAALTTKSGAESRYKAREREREELKPLEEKAVQDQAEYEKRLAMMEKLQKRMEDRFYWAPVMEELALATPPSVQISRFSGNISGDGVRKGEITVDGVAAGAEGRAAAEEFRTALEERFKKRYKNLISTFKSLDDGAEVALEGRQLKTATFSIAFTFTFGTEPTTPAPVRRPRARNVAQQEQP